MQESALKENIAVIKISGYLDAVTADALDHAIEAIVKSRCYHIIIDLTDTEYIASMGWSIFLNHIKKLRNRGGDLKLVNMNDNVFEVFKVLEFFLFLRSFMTLDEAAVDFEHEVETPFHIVLPNP